jgi:hypothetical protein
VDIRYGPGGDLTAKFFVSAAGLLSVPMRPPFKGVDSFQGDWYVTGRWPKKPVDFTGIRAPADRWPGLHHHRGWRFGDVFAERALRAGMPDRAVTLLGRDCVFHTCRC